MHDKAFLHGLSSSELSPRVVPRITKGKARDGRKEDGKRLRKIDGEEEERFSTLRYSFSEPFANRGKAGRSNPSGEKSAPFAKKWKIMKRIRRIQDRLHNGPQSLRVGI
jgi:hypothetical protein